VLRYLALDLMAVADARQRGGDRRTARRRRFRLVRPRAQPIVLAPEAPVGSVARKPAAAAVAVAVAVAVEATVA
jgi:hypothetical protein